jgi:hypothetical protein
MSLACAIQIRCDGINCLREAGATVYIIHADHPDVNVRRAPGHPPGSGFFVFRVPRLSMAVWPYGCRDAHKTPQTPKGAAGSSFMGVNHRIVLRRSCLMPRGSLQLARFPHN